MFVCVECQTNIGSGFRRDLPVPVRGDVVVFGTGLGFEELTEKHRGVAFPPEVEGGIP